MRTSELSAIAFGHHGHGLIMLLKAHFDASGTEADAVLTVGGYLAPDIVCEDIEREWITATGGKVFHLCDFGTRDCKLGSGNWTDQEREDFLKKLAAIVNRDNVSIISVSIDTAAYRNFLKTAAYAEIQGPPYSGCVQACTHFTEVTLLRNHLNFESLAYVFEKGDREHELTKTLNDYEKRHPPTGERSHHFLPKKTVLLQPADLIAGATRTVLVSANSAGKCLDNGIHSRTMLRTFKSYYSPDGVTAALVTGHDNGGCFVANNLLFKALDVASQRVAKNNPAVVSRRLKQLNSTPKSRRGK